RTTIRTITRRTRSATNTTATPAGAMRAWTRFGARRRTRELRRTDPPNENGRLAAPVSSPERNFRSDVDRLEEGRERRFLDRFRHGRMRMAGAGEIFGRAAEFHQHRGLVD